MKNTWLQNAFSEIIVGGFLGATLGCLEVSMEGVEYPEAAISTRRGWLPLAGLVFGVIGAGFSTYIGTPVISIIGDYPKLWPLIVPFPIAWASLILA